MISMQRQQQQQRVRQRQRRVGILSSVVVMVVVLLSTTSTAAFSAVQVASTSTASTSTSSQLAMLHSLRDADWMEELAGGERYEMVPLPDSMLDTTLFVGNLCDFCKDGDLSALFSQVSQMSQSLPAVVARKVNMDSLRYGFVCFPTEEEKEVRPRKYLYLYSTVLRYRIHAPY